VQQDESHFSKSRERNAVTMITQVDGALPHPKASPVLPLRELHYIEISPAYMMEYLFLCLIEECSPMFKEWRDQLIDLVGAPQRAL
jgi:hypothetical protein